MRTILAVALIFNVLLAVVYGADSPIKKRGIFSRNHRPRDVRRRYNQILPPIAIPGIMDDYDPARIYHRGKRMFNSELNSLENRFPHMDKVFSGDELMTHMHSPNRIKRSLMEGEQMIYVPQPMAHRQKRDLRRLKRDLDYATGYAYPEYTMSKRNRNHGLVAYPDYAPVEDSESLSQGIDILEYLALLKQAGELPSLGASEKYYNAHSFPSRFAPQPKLFPEDILRKESGRLRTTHHLPQGRIIWSPEKRSSASHLSMVPGFKRSSFREAERMTPESTRANHKSAILNEVLGKEAKARNLRRVAM